MPPSPALLEARPTLMVVDMQPGFLACASEAVQTVVTAFCANVVDIVQGAVRDGEQVVLVGWRDHGSIEPPIYASARHARGYARLTKSRMDLLDPDGEECATNLRALSVLRGSSARVRVVGVSATACVLATVGGLVRAGIRCEAPIHGTLEHANTSVMGLYRSYNDPLRIIREFEGITAPHPTLDMSLLRSQNLVDLHIRLSMRRKTMRMAT